MFESKKVRLFTLDEAIETLVSVARRPKNPKNERLLSILAGEVRSAVNRETPPKARRPSVRRKAKK